MKNLEMGTGRDPLGCLAGSFVLDKHGREIKPGDVIKVRHFIGRRRKIHYMYKWVLREERLGKSQIPFLRISHLKTGNVEESYLLKKDGSKLEEYEIVAGFGLGHKNGGFDPFDERPILCPLNRNFHSLVARIRKNIGRNNRIKTDKNGFLFLVRVDYFVKRFLLTKDCR